MSFYNRKSTGGASLPIDLTADVTGILPSANGGTANGFTKFTGPTTAEKTFTLPDASSTILVDGGALGTPSSGIATNLTGLPEGGLALTDITTNNVSTSKHGFAPKGSGVATEFLNGNGAYSAPASGGLSANVINGALNTASTVNISHGLGTTPTTLIVHGLWAKIGLSTISGGGWVSGTQSNVYMYRAARGDGLDATKISTEALYGGATIVVNSVDATNINITRAGSNTPTWDYSITVL